MSHLLGLNIGWGTTLAIKTVIVLGLIPVDRADPRLHVPAEDDEPHAEPARADGPGRVPRLVPARRRRHQVHAEGRRDARARPTGACSRSAPAVVVISTFLVFVVIPAGPRVVVQPLDVGVFYALAVSSLSVIGVLMAGWASANKYALLGALRAAAQLIAYELPLVLAVVGVVVQAGTMNLQGIVLAQQGG